MLSLSPYLKEKFEQDFLTSNLPEGKYIKPLLQQQNITRWTVRFGIQFHMVSYCSENFNYLNIAFIS